MKPLLAGAAAVVALLVVLTSAVVLAPASGAPSSPPGVGLTTVASDPAYFATLSADLSAHGDSAMIPALGSLPLGVVRAFLSVNEDPNSTQAQVNVADRNAFVASSEFHVAFNWGNLLLAAAGGCALGAIVGAVVGALPGAGIGCAAGAAAAAAAYLFVNAENGPSITSYAEADTGLVNELKLVNGEGQAIGALLPATQYFFGRLASVAAMNQIGSSTWNASEDLQQSTIPTQLGTGTVSLLAEANQVVSEWAQFGASQGTCMQLASVSGGLNTGDSGCIPSGGFPLILAFGNSVTLYGPIFSTQAPGTATTTCAANQANVASSVTSTAVHTASPLSCVLGSATYGYSSAAYSVVPGATVGAVGGNFTTASGWAGWEAGVPFCISGTCTYSVGFSTYGSYGIRDPVTSFNIGALGTRTMQSYLGNVSNVYNETAAIEINAVADGQAYWQYLRALGFTDPNAIPAQYQIIPPIQALPADICINGVSVYAGTSFTGTCLNLNYTEMYTLYLSSLHAMAEFFNSSDYQNGPSPCRAMGSCTYWGNLNEYGTGSIYLPGAKNSTGLGPEVFGNTSQWNVSKQQLLFFPEALTVSIPVGKVFEVPANAPLEAYTVQTGTLLGLTGNGTDVAQARASGLLPATVTSGDAIYLTSCTINGVASANCTVSPYTVNVTVTQLQCTATASTCPTGGGIFGGLPNPFTWLANLLGSLFGGGPLGALVGGIAAALLILAVILVLGYVAFVEVEAWGGKKRGGSGGGGSTVVVTGGR